MCTYFEWSFHRNFHLNSKLNYFRFVIGTGTSKNWIKITYKVFCNVYSTFNLNVFSDESLTLFTPCLANCETKTQSLLLKINFICRYNYNDKNVDVNDFQINVYSSFQIIIVIKKTAGGFWRRVIVLKKILRTNRETSFIIKLEKWKPDDVTSRLKHTPTSSQKIAHES